MPIAAKSEAARFDEIIFSRDRFDRHMLDCVGRCDPKVDAVVRQAILLGGKRLRPRIAFLAARAVGPCDERILFDAATAVEYLHTASLIHDDIVDEAALRRGGEALHRAWGPKESVLSGDFMLARSLHLLSQIGGEAVSVIALAASRMASGQVRDAALCLDSELSAEICLSVAADKTASLFCASAHLGAIAAGAGPRQTRALAEYGECLGVAFQLIDDILDIEGDEKTLGKSPGTDFREGKVTLPILFALQNGSEAQRETIRRALTAPCLNGILDDALKAASEAGCPPAKESAWEHAEKAKRQLQCLADGKEKDELATLADKAVERIR